jgi:excisionase family DNA binding protein
MNTRRASLMDSQLLDIGQAAEMLNCSAKTVWRLRDSGALREVRVGVGLVRFERAEVDRYIASRRAESKD